MDMKLTKEHIVDVLKNEDWHEFVKLHPHIWQYRELLLDDDFIFSADGTQLSDEQINDIHNIAELNSYVVVYTNEDGKKQAYFNYHNGTNGKEGDAVSSIHDVYMLMNNIKNKETVEWTTLLNYFPDHCDDVYTWFITFKFK